MVQENLTEAQKNLKKISQYLCIGVIFISITVLSGWYEDIEILKRFSLTSVGMNPLSAIFFILLALAILLRKNEYRKNFFYQASRGIAILVFLISILKIIFTILDIDFKVDQLLFSQSLYDYVYNGRNVITLSSAFSFSLTSISIAALDFETKKGKRPAQFLSILVTLLALLIVYGYLYKVNYLHGKQSILTMGVNSALNFMLLSVAILFARPNKGSMAIVISDSTTEVVLLRFLALFLPLILGYMKIEAIKAGYISNELATAIFAVVTYALAMFLLGRKSVVQFRLKKMKTLADRIIKEDAEKLKAILDNSNAAIYIKNRAGEYLNTNQRYRELFELESTESTQRKKDNQGINSIKYELDNNEKEIFESGKIIDIQEHRLKKDRLISLLTVKFPLTDSRNRIVSVCGISTDITKLKEYETELIEKEKRLHTVIDNIGEGIVGADSTGKFTLFNKMGEEILGVGLASTDPVEWSKKYFVYYPDGKTLFPYEMLPLSLALQGIYVDEEEVLICNPRFARCKRISITGRPIRKEDGTYDGVVVFRDVTEKRDLQEDFNNEIFELEEKNKFTETIINSIPCYIYVYNVNGNEFKYQNDYLKQQLNYQKEEYLELSKSFFKEIIHPDDHLIIQQLINSQELLKAKESRNIKMRLKRKDSSYSTFLMSLTLSVVNKNKDTYIIGCAIEFIEGEARK